MTAQILVADLNTLISDSKRKLPELRTAAEKSLADLKSLPATSDSQLSADIARRPQLIEPFLIACNSKNAKFALTAANCLQRLAVSSALPKGRLREVLEAIRECSSLSLDVQLKVLQTLTPVLQNYPSEVRGNLLFSLLQTCSMLQSSKIVTISSTAAATFQSALSSLFEELGREDKRVFEIPPVIEVAGLHGQVQIRPVAHDALRTFEDLCLLAQGERPSHIRLSVLPDASVLELIEIVLANYAETLNTHPELAHVLGSNLFPHLVAEFQEKRTFSIIVRVSRLLYMIIRNHQQLFPAQCAKALEFINQAIDQNDTSISWKRVICLEMFRGIFMEPRLVLELYSTCDQQAEGKPVVGNCISSFVRLASEKPALIGLGQQSTIPIGNYFQRETGPESSGNVISDAIAAEGTAGVGTSAVPGICNQYSAVRAPLIDQLDKSDAPQLPETYVYSLVLSCLNNLAESLAKFVLPLTAQRTEKPKKRSKKHTGAGEDSGAEVSADNTTDRQSNNGLQRASSLRKRNVPVNPLSLETHPEFKNVQTAASLIDQCWPAILASCSTFFYAALDSEHYRALVRSFQKFAQVAGLLRMSTPRDAFLTTLGKAAVPAHVLAAASVNSNVTNSQPPNLLRSASGILSVDSLVNQATNLLPDRARRPSLDASESTINSRNLLCMRALLNLAIALGPALEASWSIVFETLQQADKVLSIINLRPVSSRGPQAALHASTQPSGDSVPVQSQVFASEVSAIHAATIRLFESTSDFPNDSFVQVLQALCLFIDPKQSISSPPPTPGAGHRRVSSFSGMSAKGYSAEKNFAFVLSKVGELTSSNTDRFVEYPPAESGWDVFASAVTSVATQPSIPSTARLLAAELLSRRVREIVLLGRTRGQDEPDNIEVLALSSISSVCTELSEALLSEETTSFDDTNNEVHAICLETLRAVIEQTGENLIDGWRLVFDIVCTAFALDGGDGVANPRNSSALKTVELGRSAFASVQLICLDFLRSVPEGNLLNLIDTIYRFARQDADLNMSLTATTLFWNVSDLLYAQVDLPQLGKLSNEHEGFESLSPSPMSFWIALLRRIRDTGCDAREEVRTGAIATLVRIFDNHGEDLSPEAWQLMMQTILLELLESDMDSFPEQNELMDQTEIKSRVATSKLLLEGFGKLVASYLEIITRAPRHEAIWLKLTSTLDGYLAHEQHDLSEAVFRTMTVIFKAIQSADEVGVGIFNHLTNVWTSRIPTSPSKSLTGSNQAAYQAYVQTLQEIYRLVSKTIGDKDITRILDNLRKVLVDSDGSSYSSDVDAMTTLQKQVLSMVLELRSDLEGSAAALLNFFAELIRLPFNYSDLPEQRVSQSDSRRLTFVAISKAVMDVVPTFVREHLKKVEILDGPLLEVLKALETPITLKYSWKKQGKNPVIWQKATTTLLDCLKHTSPLLADSSIPEDQVQKYWDVIVCCGKGIASAQVDEAAEEAPIFDDEDFDVDALSKFRDLVIPALGSATISDSTRRSYARALFVNSIIHPVEQGELPDLDNEPARDLYKIRYGRTYNPEPTLRGLMSYHCLSDLIALVSKSERSAERVQLAQAAAPYFILRAVMTLRLYVADHPLRGRYMPLPASQREELLFILKHSREMDSEPNAIPETDGVKTLTKRHLVRLYPLVVKAFEVEGRRAKPDGELMEEMRRVLEAIGGEFRL